MLGGLGFRVLRFRVVGFQDHAPIARDDLLRTILRPLCAGRRITVAIRASNPPCKQH